MAGEQDMETAGYARHYAAIDRAGNFRSGRNGSDGSEASLVRSEMFRSEYGAPFT